MSTVDADATALHPFPFADWLIATLPFSPAAINDANLIVGQQSNKAVQYQNGNLQMLPSIVSDGGFSAAVDVSSLGAIVGKTSNIQQQPAVVWFPLPLALPEAPVGVFVPAAINKNLNVVGSSLDAQMAFKWHDPFGYQFLAAPGTLRNKPTFATDVNDHGYSVGFVEELAGATPLLWTPDNLPHIPWHGASARSHPHINNNGDVALLDGSQNVTVLHLNGTISSFLSIPDPLSVDGISDEGRIIGTSKVAGATKGWTFYKNQLTWLSPPPSHPSAFVQPTGVNTCGNIVGLVSSGPDTGVVYTKQLPFRCDGAIVSHPF
jgi:hypothetical protein